MSADELAFELKVSPAKVNAMVAIMEMKGVLSTALGKIFIAKA